MSFQGFSALVRREGTTKDSWHGFHCAHCDRSVSGAVVAYTALKEGNTGNFVGEIKWLQCTVCGEGSVETSRGQLCPGSLFGPPVEGLPERVEMAYEEARRCMSVSAYTACELICRSVIAYTSLDKVDEAKEEDGFSKHIAHLESAGFITPPMKPWVDLIRQHGNESTHTLEIPDEDRAKSTLMFTAELLRLVYEMEYLAEKYAGADKGDE